MRVVSETKYYKVLAKLYDKCASLSAQLDIYEFDSPKIEQSDKSDDDNLIQRAQNKKKQKYIPNTIIKFEEEEQQKQQHQYLSKNKKTITQNNGKSTKIKKKIKKPKNYDFSSTSSQTSTSSYN
ncbi:unnamed protein product [Paramecium octaurelia]|uniref:Uncharacterized protein n=1 Tax=Paramecium octaurelia TaxID=43137 RepID=A0A8S1VM17_PAROT|nr:unnamed protein product [Paramecium octaurelia]